MFKGNNSDRERQVLYDVTEMWGLQNRVRLPKVGSCIVDEGGVTFSYKTSKSWDATHGVTTVNHTVWHILKLL